MKLKTSLKVSLRTSTCKLANTITKQHIDDLEEDISKDISDTNTAKVSDQISELIFDGKFSQSGMWKLKSRMCPRSQDPPMAKKDSKGNLITTENGLRTLYLETYRQRLRHRKIKAEYDDLLRIKSELWTLRLKQFRKKVTKPWTLAELDKALKSLKNNQSRDPLGMINELFKPGMIGNELKSASLSLLNHVKFELCVPRNMELSDITSIFKNKGSRLELKNDSGIFVLTVLRKILDKLTYFDKYPHLDKSMLSSNIGALKNKNIRDHLFIIHVWSILS